MARVGITAYDLLISCPGDVSGFIDVIKDSIGSFNKMFGVINDIEVIPRHWSTDSFPQSGDKPQELLNQQFVRECDAAIALFWTRFGTPTDKYESGTEEEIEELLSADKQVFMYFLDMPVNPSEVDMDQYRKVLEFKDKYKDKGIYDVISNEHELQRKLFNHLTSYFLTLVEGRQYISKKQSLSILKISESNSKDDKYSAYQTNLLNSQFMIKEKEKILMQIKDLNENNLLERVKDNKYKPKEIKKVPSTNFENLNISLSNSLNFVSKAPAVISDILKKEIVEFASENNIDLNQKFWNLGSLEKHDSRLALPMGYSGSSLVGTEEEKKRYESIRKLYWEIITYNEYIEYFSKVDDIYRIDFIISNSGSTFDEDIDIKLYIPKGHILKYTELPYPGINIIETVLDMKLVEYIFSREESESIERFGYYPPPLILPKLSPMFVQTSAEEEYKEDKEEYKEDKEEYRVSLENLFIYKLFESEKHDILTIHLPYLKHNISMAFPSFLIFEKIPDFIEYEIYSKHIPEVIKGSLSRKEITD